MGQTIQIKRSTGTDAPTSLANGELAYLNNSSAKKLYIGRPGGNTGDIDIIGGKDTVDLADGALQRTGGQMTGNITMQGAQTVDGRDLSVDGAKLDGIASGANNFTLTAATATVLGGIKIGTGLTIDGDGVVTADEVDSDAVEAAGALMDSEVTNLAQVKAFDSSDYATAAQGTKADNALPKAGGTMTGHLRFGDTKSIFLGASDDFQLVHSTSGGSFIVDQGPGAFKLVTNGTGVVINGGGSTGGSASTNLATFHSDTSASTEDQFYVQLNHGSSSSQKFRTTSTGVSVTGNIAVTGNVDGRDVAADGTKLDTVEENAGVTPSWVPSSNPNYLTSETFASSDAGNFSFSGNTMSTSGATMTLDPSTSGVGGTVVVEGSLTVKGTTTTVNSTSVNLEDNIIVLNKGEASAPSADAGLEVERGTAVNAYLVWDESEDRWSVALGGGNGNNNEILQSTMHAINHEGAAIDGGTF